MDYNAADRFVIWEQMIATKEVNMTDVEAVAEVVHQEVVHAYIQLEPNYQYETAGGQE